MPRGRLAEATIFCTAPLPPHYDPHIVFVTLHQPGGMINHRSKRLPGCTLAILPSSHPQLIWAQTTRWSFCLLSRA